MTRQLGVSNGVLNTAGKGYSGPTPIGHEAAALAAELDATANSPKTYGSNISDRDRRLAVEQWRQTQEMRRRWQATGVPARHAVRVKELREAASGPWAEKYKRLRDQLADGFVVALLGPRGTGKTQMATCLIRDEVEAGRTALYVRASDLFLELRDKFRKDPEESERDVLQRFCSVGLLVIDEAHEVDGTDYEARMLTDVVDARYGRVLSTLLLSNLMPKSFAQAVGSSIVSRVHECGSAIVCDWPSFRIPSNTPSRAPSAKRENEQVTKAATVTRADQQSPRPLPAPNGILPDQAR